MQSGQGGIRWNSVTNYIQLMDENKNWTNWSYYKPTTPVSLIPVTIKSDSYTRADGVVINLSSNPTTESYRQFNHNGGYMQITGVGAYYTIQFSVPQVITSFQFYNYQSNTGRGKILVQRSMDGATFEDIMTYTTIGSNSGLENISISNPAAAKYFRLTTVAIFHSSDKALYKDSTLYGYSYSA